MRAFDLKKIEDQLEPASEVPKKNSSFRHNLSTPTAKSRRSNCSIWLWQPATRRLAGLDRTCQIIIVGDSFNRARLHREESPYDFYPQTTGESCRVSFSGVDQSTPLPSSLQTAHFDSFVEEWTVSRRKRLPPDSSLMWSPPSFIFRHQIREILYFIVNYDEGLGNHPQGDSQQCQQCSI